MSANEAEGGPYQHRCIVAFPVLTMMHVILRRVEYLTKFSPSPSSASASFAGALVERMAGRILMFFVRHASLLRPLSQAGKVQLAKVSPTSS